MSMKLYAIIMFCAGIICFTKSNAQTNKSLSNLTSPTAINQSLLPDVNNSKDLGSDALGWRNLYLTSHIYFDKNIVLHAQGSGNIFLGAFAGNASLLGTYNTANGVYALSKLTTGNNN